MMVVESTPDHPALRVAFFKYGDVVAEASGAAVTYDGMVGYYQEMLAISCATDRLIISLGDRRASGTMDRTGLEVLPKPAGGLLHRVRGFLAVWAEEMRLIECFRPDCVVALDTGYHALALYLAARRAGAVFVLAVPGQITGPRLRDRLRRSMVRWISRRSRTVAVLSRGDFLAREIVTSGIPADKVTVFYPRYDAADLPPVSDGECGPPLEVTFVGRLSEVKGVEDLPAVLEAITSVPSARLRVIGDGHLRDLLERAFRDHPSDRWELSGGLPHSGVLRALSGAAIVVVPSRFEGIAKSVMEAVIMGRPVVAYDVGGIGDWVTDGVNGRLLPQGDREGLAAAVLGLLRDADLRARMRAGARERGADILGLSPTFAEALGVVLRESTADGVR